MFLMMGRPGCVLGAALMDSEERLAIKREALEEYAQAVEENLSADLWDRVGIARDVRDWAEHLDV